MNKNQEIDTKNIRMVGLRYFNEEANGIELSDNLGYAFLVNTGNNFYVNPFNPIETYPLFQRTLSSNKASNGEDFGSKITLVCGEEKTGPCYVALKKGGADIFGKDIVTVEEIEEYILNSPRYFMDRRDIAISRFKSGRHPVRMQRIVKADEESHAKMVDFFEERSVQIQKVKSKK